MSQVVLYATSFYPEMIKWNPLDIPLQDKWKDYKRDWTALGRPMSLEETLVQKKDNQTKEVLAKQIRKSIPKNSNNKNTIIAYEPVWAIGTGLTPSLEEINDIHNFIKNEIQDYENFQKLYGGSVKSTN